MLSKPGTPNFSAPAERSNPRQPAFRIERWSGKIGPPLAAAAKSRRRRKDELQKYNFFGESTTLI
jgi:hypothetical protein